MTVRMRGFEKRQIQSPPYRLLHTHPQAVLDYVTNCMSEQSSVASDVPTSPPRALGEPF